jgi:N-acyl-D-amino-acid deacylase
VDLVLTDARVVDGTGAAAFRGWVAVAEGTITAVGREGEAVPPATEVRSVQGRVVAPGFIDVHNHSDFTVHLAPGMDSSIAQGVTTVVVGNCGLSPAPSRAGSPDGGVLHIPTLSWERFGDYLDAVQDLQPAVNVAALVGFAAVRRTAMEDTGRPATQDEITTMRNLVRDAFEAGAVGFSTGLIYDPDMHAPTSEVVAVAAALTGTGRRYCSHIRGEGRELFAAVDEAIHIGQLNDIGVQISHLKLESRPMWNRAGQVLERIREARTSVDVAADQYPYAAYQTGLFSFMPPWAQRDRFASVLRNERTVARLRRAVEEGEGPWQSSVLDVGWDRIAVTTHSDSSVVGRSVADIAGTPNATDAAFELLMADPDCGVIGHAMDEADVREILAAPDVAVSSDGLALPFDGPLSTHGSHPRSYGTYPRVLGRYVREGVLDLETAVHKMTGLPAELFKLHGRGRIAPGAVADLVELDPDTVHDTADFLHSQRRPEGIRSVWVGGQVAWRDGAPGACAGRVLRA